MSTPISPRDERSIQRFLDGELPADEAAVFAQRLDVEPQLQARRQQLQGLRAGFAADRRAIEHKVGSTAPAGFTASVLVSVRQLPADGKWRRDILDERVLQRWCRRLLIAAAILATMALAWHSGLFTNREVALQASPAEMEREMDRLDRMIREHTPVGAPATAPSARGK
jgi:hypothetical protein